MPHRTGGSHALATLTTMLASGLLLAYYRRQLDLLIGALTEVSVWLVSSFELPMSTDLVTTVLVASLLSALWGIGFHYTHQ